MNSFPLSFLALFCSISVLANNVQISNVSLVNQNTDAKTYQVKFDVSWENSWRSSTLESNYDAIWIFIKFRNVEQLDWNRGLVSTSGFVAPSGSTILVPPDAIGAFLQRSSNGIGNVNFSNVQLQWNYGGIPDDAAVEVSVFAIEMVYIPGGAFVVGDDAPNVMGNFEAGSSTNPFTISNENALTLGGTAVTNLSNNNASGMGTLDDFNDATTQTLPTAYPKGTDPFYIMKYELSQGQYAAFLNKLSSTAAINRFPDQTGNLGHNIADTGPPPNVYVTSTPDRACNFLSWGDLAAYADWSGLRPMSELEYEKACRGSRLPLPEECAWGTPYAFNQQYTVADAGQPNETFSNVAFGTGNALYITTGPTISGPRRSGIFAASFSSPSRAESGATYFGVMEMSGNVWEICVGLGTSNGRSFTGNHGNGVIGTTTGNSTVAGWPPFSGGSSGVGIGLRGGGFSNPLGDLNVSKRRLATFTVASRFSDVGGRLVKSNF